MTDNLAISVASLSHHYGERQALNNLSLDVRHGEVFAVLGPNGGGKTTLFKVLSTLFPPQTGNADVFGVSLARDCFSVRMMMGVVFQAPSLDIKLTVMENMRHQGALYGLSGSRLRTRATDLLEQFGLSDRASERCETLSGGLKRRVELAKGLIHQPRLLLLDEPEAGLDPGARADMWRYLYRLRDEQNMTIAFTTHLLDQADKADRIAILHLGELVALDTPDALRASVGGDSIAITSAQPDDLVSNIQSQFDLQPRVVDGGVRLEIDDGHEWIARLVKTFPDEIQSITLGKPSLEDVFIQKTGCAFHETDAT